METPQTEPWDKPNTPIVWYNKNTERSNRFCLYCGRYVGPGSSLASNKEHLIGRNFVPRGFLSEGTGFNFIFRSCTECNQEKGNYEAHISSVTLFNSPSRNTNKQVDDVARKKGNRTYHPDNRGKLVKDSSVKHTISVNINPKEKLTFGIIGPAQLNRNHVNMLAFYQIKALYTLITIKRGKSFADDDYYQLLDSKYFRSIGFYQVTDWGNHILLALQNKVRDWPCLVIIDTADGHFRTIIRSNASNDSKLWFWALEWNKYVRVFGTIGDPNNSNIFISDIQGEPYHLYNTSDGEDIRIHVDRRLDPEQDFLFSGRLQDDES